METEGAICATDIQSGVVPEECKRLSELARGLVVLELGAEWGRSTIALASTASQVHSVDWHLGDKHAGMKDTLSGFMKNLDRYGVRNKVIVHVGRNEDVLPKLAPKSFDMAFIDSFHEGHAVKADISLVLPVLKSNGIIAFHDFGSYFPGVTETVKEFAASKGLPIERVGNVAIVKLG